VSDTAANGVGAVKFNAPLMQYLDSGRVVWLDGIDFLYDIYKKTPTTFTTGDFVYDVMGIETYVAQTHKDDSLGSFNGLPMALKVSGNTINTLDTIRWKWSSLWNGDALDITTAATALYEMGPSNYDFAGKIIALYKENMVTSSLRIGSLGTGSTYAQDDINVLVKEMVQAAEAGTFVKAPVGIIENKLAISDVNAYPNPASSMITFTFPVSQNVTLNVYDISGRLLINEVVNGNSGLYKANVSALNSGIYFYQISIDNSVVTRKFSIVK
jgi:hypothetical protein